MLGELEIFRQKISEIDEELVRLFIERMAVVAKVGEYKADKNLIIYDPIRERAEIERFTGEAKTEFDIKYVEQFLKNLMFLSRGLQEDISKLRVGKNVYGLIGEKLGHSFSPQIHGEIFKTLKIEGEYKLFELEEEELKSAIYKYKEQGVKGLNVTIPYKVKIMDYLDVISKEAEKIGAVNTISFANGILTGYNTDYNGFGMSLLRSQVEVRDKSAVILGTGGASKAVVQYLIDNGAKSITYMSRNPGDGADRSKHSIRTVGYDEISYLKGDIIINCTPCGMYPKVDVSPVPYYIFNRFGTAVDLIYNPEETMFLKQAKESGLKTINGLYMLVSQAVAAEKIWNRIELSGSQVDNIYQYIKDLIYKVDAGKNI